MNKTNFDELLHRYLTGQVSEAEKIKIETWLETLKHNDDPHFKLSEEEEEKIFQRITDKTTTVEQVKTRSLNEKRVTLLRIAASVSAILIAGLIGWYVISKDSMPLLGGATGDVQKVILSDGTIVWLTAESNLDYYEKNLNGKTTRQAVLTGGGLFEIAKDPSRPFIITCANNEVSVLGTSFWLEQRDDTVSIDVLTGKVNVSDLNHTLHMDLQPNDKLVIRGKQVLSATSVNTAEVAAIIEKTEYNMSFDNVLLGDVIERLENKFDQDIKIKNKSISNCRITADFTDRSLERSLEMITEVLNVEYVSEEGGITLTGSGCQ